MDSSFKPSRKARCFFSVNSSGFPAIPCFSASSPAMTMSWTCWRGFGRPRQRHAGRDGNAEIRRTMRPPREFLRAQVSVPAGAGIFRHVTQRHKKDGQHRPEREPNQHCLMRPNKPPWRTSRTNGRCGKPVRKPSSIRLTAINCGSS